MGEEKTPTRRDATAAPDVRQTLQPWRDRRLSGKDTGAGGGKAGGCVWTGAADLRARCHHEPPADLGTGPAPSRADMFSVTAAIGGLDVQLVYFRGLGECRGEQMGERTARGSAT